eukprot:jgi/Astpho2/5298/e_gw1.00075.46.1_t
MLELYPRSLVLVSAFGLLDGGAQLLSGASIGQYIDRTDRLRCATSMYIIQNAAVAASAATALISFHAPSGTPLFWIPVSATILIGSISSVGAMGSTLSVEKEWTKTLCGTDSAALARLNSGMRAVDLTCLIAAPLAAGCLMTYGGIQVAIAAIALWNVMAWAPECLLLRRAQSWSSALSVPEAEKPAVQGMSEAELSVYRGIGAVSGLLSTYTFPALQSRLGGLCCCLLGIYTQLTCLVVAVSPALLSLVGTRVAPASTTHILVGGLVASRFGLWTFDLCVTQLLQEWVLNEELGAVNGVQSSLQSLFGSLTYAAGLVVWRPEDFSWLMLGSTGIVATAAAICTMFVLRHSLDAQKEVLPTAEA